MATKVILMRHGETVWNEVGRWQGHAPVPLNDFGRMQSAETAQHLHEFQPLDVIYTSDLLRAYQTAEIVADKFGQKLRVDARLREIDLGAWQGLTRAEIMEWDGERYQALWQQHHVPRPGGESLSDVGERAGAALAQWVEKHDNTTLLVVTHSGTIRAIMYHFKLAAGMDVELPNASLTTLVFDAGWQLLTVGRVFTQ